MAAGTLPGSPPDAPGKSQATSARPRASAPPRPSAAVYIAAPGSLYSAAVSGEERRSALEGRPQGGRMGGGGQGQPGPADLYRPPPRLPPPPARLDHRRVPLRRHGGRPGLGRGRARDPHRPRPAVEPRLPEV